MDYYFVKDFKKNYRFFSSHPIHPIEVNFTKWRKRWEEAKRRLMMLPPKILSQEQAFERALKIKDQETIIYYSGIKDKDRMKRKFSLFLEKQRSKHFFLLLFETILLPISGVMAFLPGPNVFFYVLFLIMYTQWRAMRGIKILIHKNHEFVCSSLLKEWESAVESRSSEQMEVVIEKMAREFPVNKIRKILYQ
jgi:hypothetical protein